MDAELEDAVVVDFPLRGEGWLAVNSPAARIPSHGTDMLGQRYAFDLLRVDERRRPMPGSPLRAALLGCQPREHYAWGRSVHAPFDGEVVVAVDGVREPGWLHPVRDLGRMLWNGFTFRPSRLPAVLGNHVVLRHGSLPGVFAGLVHLAPGTLAVTVGQEVRTGDLLGRVGHTGNSTAPHLHFQLMDAADPLVASGVPCAFSGCESEKDGRWVAAERLLPGPDARVRHT